MKVLVCALCSKHLNPARPYIHSTPTGRNFCADTAACDRRTKRRRRELERARERETLAEVAQ